MDSTVHMTFPETEIVIPDRFPLFSGTETTIPSRFPTKRVGYLLSKWGIDPERDIWSLGVMVQGSGQMGELLGRRRRRRRRRRRHLEIGVWNSFSFRAWIGLIWEISPRKPDHSAWNFGARLFCKNPKNQEKSYFQYFQDMGKIEKSIFQYFQD